jgi:O-antigen/teichoic acid export membrane protein
MGDPPGGAPGVLARKSLLHFLNTLVGALVGVLALKLIALYMGDDLFGQVAYAKSLTGLLFAVMLLGFPAAHKKRMSEGERPGDCLATYMVVQGALTLTYIAIILGAIVFRFKIQGKGLTSTTLSTLIVMAAFHVVKFWQRLTSVTLTSQREIAREQFAEFSDNLVRTVSAVVVALVYAVAAKQTGPLATYLGPGYGWVAAWGPELLAATWLLGSAAATVASAFYIYRDYPVGSFRWDVLRSYWDFARPIYVAGLVGTVATRLDRVMLGYFWGSSSVGIYFGSQRIVSVVKSASFALGVVLLPAVSSLSVDGNEDRIAEITNQAHRYTSMLTLPLVIFIMAFAGPIIHLVLSDEFLRGAPTLSILAAWTFFAVTSRPYSALVSGVDRPRLLAAISISGAAANVLLNIVLIPADIQSLGVTLFGLRELGAAIATLTMSLITYVLYRRVARRLVPLDPDWPYLLRQLTAGIVMTAVLFVLDETVAGLARWYHLILFSAVGGTTYLLALVLVGGFTRSDLRFFLETVDPRAMATYVRDELFGGGD